MTTVSTGTRAGIYWDQVVVPRTCERLGVDVFFGPFMTVPVVGRFKKIMTVHGAERYVIAHLLSWKTHLNWMFMERVLLPRTDRVIGISETMRREFCRATRYPADRVTVTYLGASPDFRTKPSPTFLRELRARYSLPDRFFLFVGFVFPNKNLKNVVTAMSLLREPGDHHLVLAGGHRWKDHRDFTLIDKLKLGSRIHSLGFLPREDLIGLYSLADAFVYASLYESFGLAGLEALAAGSPVVAAHTGALPEILGDAALFCDPYDPEDIARALRQIAQDRGSRSALVEKGLERARRFTWERCARETLAIIEAVHAER